MVTYYKCLRAGREATHVPGFHWPPPGEWLEVEGDLVACENGLHVARVDQLPQWLSDELWTVEVDGDTVDVGDKTVVRRARLVAQVPDCDYRLRMFAADCAERVLHLFEAERPHDDRPRRAIEAARAFARGEIDAAAGAAAWAAAGDAAGEAAWAAAGAAAGDAEHAWQVDRLRHWLEVDL
jgi:hypothetical protein